MQLLDPVAPRRDDPTVQHRDRADRDFACQRRLARQQDRFAHEALVGGGIGRHF